jgi:K+-transporting ATPase A subunit
LRPQLELLEPTVDTSGAAVTVQHLPLGPVASQVAIKQLGTNGGGFFNANSAHPFENPTPLSNFLEMLAILLIPTSLCYTFGKMVGDTRQGWTLLAAMTAMFCAALAACLYFEQRGTPGSSIFVSMERNMKCAVGVCGHCQFGPWFVCKDGPVFRYDKIERFFGMREV